ncbi:unnamed protein product [marine sediment metagenome]|uniref:Histidine kinase/HSP90-like ATPase domain-containing protein n=1 Tax=marine sediment metagenome TaxID=412755 RepID=X1AVI5_9ZZZZ
MIENENIIKADPTKEFFIDMLTLDIASTKAINDLIDNCVDGANRIRSEKNYEGLEVRIEAGPKQFRIIDNCGGISVKIARDYAFRFGRPSDIDPISKSIGLFGVGMKRALFKLGSKFIVNSRTETSRFVVEVDVDEWKIMMIGNFNSRILMNRC